MKQFSVSVRSSSSRAALGTRAVALGAIALVAFAGAAPPVAPQTGGTVFLSGLKHRATLASMIPPNGDSNPYAVVVAPATVGRIHEGHVLVDDFNDQSNLQGTGTTIVDYDPETRKTSVFATIPRRLAGCPGGVGLTAAMAVLKSGWVIVGSANSTDGTTKTKGTGCLIALDANGAVQKVWTGPKIDSPWGNVAVVDDGAKATVFVSMSGFGVPGPDVRDGEGDPVTVRKATVLRLGLDLPSGKPPEITSQTVVADGFGQRADRDAFLVGPTGLTLGTDGTLYASDALGNAVVRIPDAMTRTTSAGTGEVVTKDGLLRRPLALTTAPNGHLLAVNALNGQVVEIDPVAGKQLAAQWIDVDQAQSPPGNGDLFGIAIKPDGRGFYYVEDDANTLVEDVPR